MWCIRVNSALKDRDDWAPANSSSTNLNSPQDIHTFVFTNTYTVVAQLHRLADIRFKKLPWNCTVSYSWNGTMCTNFGIFWKIFNTSVRSIGEEGELCNPLTHSVTCYVKSEPLLHNPNGLCSLFKGFREVGEIRTQRVWSEMPYCVRALVECLFWAKPSELIVAQNGSNLKSKNKAMSDMDTFVGESSQQCSHVE